ncbi:MAG: hypothetical protein EOO02_24215, partial [Chitinophagaceae bacterium]
PSRPEAAVPRVIFKHPKRFVIFGRNDDHLLLQTLEMFKDRKLLVCHNRTIRIVTDVCKKHNPESYFISNASELQKEWFSTGDKVGICGATSTPMWLMEDVKSRLEHI